MNEIAFDQEDFYPGKIPFDGANGFFYILNY